MKILQIIHSLGNGGAEKFIVELSNEMAKEQDVILCTYKPNENWMIPPKILNVNVRNISLNICSKISFANLTTVFKLIRKERPDVVHVHASRIALYLLFFPVLFRKIRFIHTIHSSRTPAYEKLFRIFAFFSFAGLRWTNVCISKRIHDDFSHRFQGLNFVLINNGISPLSRSDIFYDAEKTINEIKKNHEAKLIVAIGNYSDLKRFDLLMNVMNHFYEKHITLYLIIIGKDVSKDQSNFLKVLKMKNENVHILGSKQSVADYLILSDALIMSSFKEGMPLVILEAMSVGKPIIASPAGGIVDMVENGVNGFLAKDLTEQALINALGEFLSASKETIEQIHSNNLKVFQTKYSISNCTEKYLFVYKQN